MARFRLDRAVVVVLLAVSAFLTARAWLHDHPQHNPWAPLDLNDPPGWATQAKLAGLRDDPAECRAVLKRSGVAFSALEPPGEGECLRPDRITLDKLPIAGRAEMTCALGAGLALWERRVQPLAETMLGSRIARIEHFGTFSCRRVYGRSTGNWSEHSTGNAIDVAGFVLADGRRVTVAADWKDAGKDAAFLHHARDEACEIFGTVLSPDYNAAHADHLHLDQAARGWGGYCR
ncbi:MAG TPA: extensin family protein [Croceibacterium sp.]|nr:extensin family protein [Croceibacterium sp.]